MRILIADDDAAGRRLLESTLGKWGYAVVVACDGDEAWAALQREDAPRLAILDWSMPGLDGAEVCRRVRQAAHPQPTHIILLTVKSSKEDLVAGLGAGADDYVVKPFDPMELLARVQVGLRMVDLQEILAHRVKELEEALAGIKRLQGLLPICCYCKKIRNDNNYWLQVETYIMEHSEAEFSHGICPDCYEKFVAPELRKLTGEKNLPLKTSR